MQSDNVLSIKNLSFSYDKKNLIYNDFNLELNKGEIISIVGASGSGKSTLFELISGNLKVNKGEIKAKKITSVFQDPYSSFHPSYTIKEQILDVICNVQEQEIGYLCKELSLDYMLILKKPHELSGGQLQRCSILRALLMKPELLLIDEPTSALDNIVAVDVMKLLIKNLNKFAILLITHDMSLAKWCSDKIIRLENNE